MGHLSSPARSKDGGFSEPVPLLVLNVITLGVPFTAQLSQSSPFPAFLYPISRLNVL